MPGLPLGYYLQHPPSSASGPTQPYGGNAPLGAGRWQLQMANNVLHLQSLYPRRPILWHQGTLPLVGLYLPDYYTYWGRPRPGGVWPNLPTPGDVLWNTVQDGLNTFGSGVWHGAFCESFGSHQVFLSASGKWPIVRVTARGRTQRVLSGPSSTIALYLVLAPGSQGPSVVGSGVGACAIDAQTSTTNTYLDLAVEQGITDPCVEQRSIAMTTGSTPTPVQETGRVGYVHIMVGAMVLGASHPGNVNYPGDLSSIVVSLVPQV